MVESDLGNLSMTYLRFELIKSLDFKILRPDIGFSTQVASFLGKMVVVEDLLENLLEVFFVSIRILRLHWYLTSDE